MGDSTTIADSTAKRFAVVGFPIEHSLSPRIHQAFAKQCQLVLSYEALAVAPDAFLARLPELIGEYQGLNITVPFKEQAYQAVLHHSSLNDSTQRVSDVSSACDLSSVCELSPICELSKAALLAKAVNTLSFTWTPAPAPAPAPAPTSPIRIYADNTDGQGLVRDLIQRHQQPITGQRILILGAGGAARGALPALCAQHPQCVHVMNRTYAKAEALVMEYQQAAVELVDQAASNRPLKASNRPLKASDTELKASDTELKASDTELKASDTELKASDTELMASDTELMALPQPSQNDHQQHPHGGFHLNDIPAYDLIINATSAGLNGELPVFPEALCHQQTFFYDMLYDIHQTTAFVAFAQQRGYPGTDGLGMLVEQAAAAFKLWQGVTPDTQAVMAQLRDL